jgi:hypothetical protein
VNNPEHSAVGRVVEALRAHGCNPKFRNGEWLARCPTHDDSTPSLVVKEANNGNALVTCRAGCPTADVAAAVGLGMRDLFVADKPKRREIVATYDYTDVNGELLFQAVRYAPKEFKQRRPDGRGGWVWNLKGVLRVLYGLPHVEATAEAGGTIYVVEGEQDADAAVLARVCATTCPMGAGKWKDAYSESLRGAERVVIVADRDDEGRKHARQVAASVSAHVEDVTIVEPVVGKDLSDHLSAGHTIDELRPPGVNETDVVDRALSEPQPVEPEDGSAPLDAAARLLRRFVTAHKHVTHVCAAWLLHAYAIDVFWTTPRLIVESPEPECGKSMLFDTMGFLLERPVTDVSTTPATLVRTLATRTPPFLLDECDKTIGRRDAAQSETLALLLAIANAGYRRGKTVSRCVGKDHEPTEFPTFAPMAFAGLNSKLDRAFRTRAISLWMDRAQPRQEFEWSEDLGDEFAALRARLRAWCDAHADEIRTAKPDRPAWMRGRLAEIWVPLMKVAHVAGGPWPRRIREAAEELGAKRRPDDYDSSSVALLRATRDVFGDRDRIHTHDVIDGLNEVEDAAWAKWNDGEGVRPIDFTNRVIKHFKLHHSKSIQIRDRNRKGYEREWFEAAWARYAPLTRRPAVSPTPLPVKLVNPLVTQGDSPKFNPSTGTKAEGPESLQQEGVDGLTGSGEVQAVNEPDYFENQDEPDSDPTRFIDPVATLEREFGATVVEEACARCGGRATTTVAGERRCAEHADPLEGT